MVKKLLAILFVTVLVFAFAACGEEDVELDCGCVCPACIDAEKCSDSNCVTGCTCTCNKNDVPEPKAPILAFANSNFNGGGFASTWIADARGIGVASILENDGVGNSRYLAIVGTAASSGRLFRAPMNDNDGRSQLTFYIRTGGIASKPIVLIFSDTDATPASFTPTAPGLVLSGSLSTATLGMATSNPVSFVNDDIAGISTWRKITVSMPNNFITKDKVFSLYITTGGYSLNFDEFMLEDPAYEAP
jgi:hypothetical protein